MQEVSSLRMPCYYIAGAAVSVVETRKNTEKMKNYSFQITYLCLGDQEKKRESLTTYIMCSMLDAGMSE